MKKLISLLQYFNMVGEELFPSEWSSDAVYYYSERKKEFSHLRHQATKTYAMAINKIWSDGNVKVSMRLEQGYIDPPFAIEQFDFAHSACISVGGDYYRCQLELKKETRGRKRIYDLKDVIDEYVIKYHLSVNVPLSRLSGEALISFIQSSWVTQPGIIGPKPSIIRKRLLEFYPECANTSRNSKK